MTDRELAKRLRETGGLDPMMVLQGAEVIERLIAERDEARRERLVLAESYLELSELAKRKGSDCHGEAP